jgi:hypothetical protein
MSIPAGFFITSCEDNEISVEIRGLCKTEHFGSLEKLWPRLAPNPTAETVEVSCQTVALTVPGRFEKGRCTIKPYSRGGPHFSAAVRSWLDIIFVNIM